MAHDRSVHLSRRALIGSAPWFVGGSLAFVALPRPVSALPNDGGPPPNVFISPCGWPFRAKDGEAYPVANWFARVDKNADGKIDRSEFMADTEIFFKFLDRNGDGVLSPPEVGFYERQIAPEILGARVDPSAFLGERGRPLLWRVQSSVRRPAAIDPGGPDVDPPHHHDHLDVSGEGAAPYSFFDEPEPVTAADFNFTGLITKENFLKLADAHFSTLDRAETGYLTLASLPRTPVQKQLEKGRHRAK